MKTRTYSQDSWLVRLCMKMNDYSPYNSRGETDICSFAKEASTALIKLAACVVFGFLVAWAGTDFLMWLFVQVLFKVFVDPHLMGGLFGMVMVLMFVAWSIFTAYDKVKEYQVYRLRKRMGDPYLLEKEPSLIGDVLLSLRDKVCFKIKFE